MTTQARGCGSSRVRGGIYLVTKLSEKGRPLENFLLDPPIIVPEEMNVPFTGMGWFHRKEKCTFCEGHTGRLDCKDCSGDGFVTVTHIADHIGSSHYPNVVDDIEEVRAIGSSRRIPSTFPFHLLTKMSRHFRCHSTAYIENWKEAETAVSCPKGISHHYGFSSTEFCIERLWGDYEPPQERPNGEVEKWVNLPCGRRFLAYRRPFGFEPIYKRAFYMALPISGIEVVRPGTFSIAYGLNVEKASLSKLNVTEVDE